MGHLYNRVMESVAVPANSSLQSVTHGEIEIAVILEGAELAIAVTAKEVHADFAPKPVCRVVANGRDLPGPVPHVRSQEAGAVPVVLVYPPAEVPIMGLMSSPNLKLELRSYDDEGQKHHHDYHQLVLPVVGRLALSVENDGGEVSAEWAAIIPAGRDHGFAAPGQNCFLVADVPEALAPVLGKLPLFMALDSTLSHYTSFLHQQLLQGGSARSTERQMLLLLIQLLQERHGDALKLDRRVDVAKAYLDEHFQEKISITDLSAVANLSVRQLNELFRKQVGMTPHHYLTELRMQHAWRLLEGSSMSIQAIAERVGYGSLAAFSDRFSRHFGHSPSYFRRITK